MGRSASVLSKYKSYSKLKACVWKWFRSRAGDTSLRPATKLVLWAICERHRIDTFSSHDAYVYYGKMTGLNRRTVGRCVDELVDAGILWIAVEGERRIVKQAKPGVRASVLSKYKSYSKLKACVWKWFRSRAGDTSLRPATKLVLWAICERHRIDTFSSHDAYVYYGKMTGLNRRTVGRCVDELVDAGILWIAVEGERRIVKQAKPGVRKHLLLVGLGVVMVEELAEQGDR